MSSYETLIKELGSNFINWHLYNEKRRKRKKEMEAKVSEIVQGVMENAATSSSETKRNDIEMEIQNCLDDMLTVVNQLIGMCVNRYSVSDEFGQFDYSKPYSNFVFDHIIFILHPALKKLKNEVQQIIEAFTEKRSLNVPCRNFAKHLVKFIPDLNLPYECKPYPLVTPVNFVQWLLKSQNREQMEMVQTMLDFYDIKLNEVVKVRMTVKMQAM